LKYSRTPLVAEEMYHIYNRAVGSENLFKSVRNYKYFLSKYDEYISLIADTFCYCLMPNHFHLLLRIKELNSLSRVLKINDAYSNNQISQQFSNLFNAYTKAYNKENGRLGSLFMKPFKRKQIKDEKYLKKVVHYIHYNPVKASIVEKPEDWKYSSYKSIIINKETKLNKQEVISWFDDIENFISCHSIPPNESGIDYFL
jgi:REP element-mobilizing transposase RayT